MALRRRRRGRRRRGRLLDVEELMAGMVRLRLIKTSMTECVYAPLRTARDKRSRGGLNKPYHSSREGHCGRFEKHFHFQKLQKLSRITIDFGKRKLLVLLIYIFPMFFKGENFKTNFALHFPALKILFLEHAKSVRKIRKPKFRV